MPCNDKTLLADSYVARLQQNAIDSAAGGQLPKEYVRNIAENVIADVVEALRRKGETSWPDHYRTPADFIECEFGSGANADAAEARRERLLRLADEGVNRDTRRTR